LLLSQVSLPLDSHLASDHPLHCVLAFVREDRESDRSVVSDGRGDLIAIGARVELGSESDLSQTLGGVSSAATPSEGSGQTSKTRKRIAYLIAVLKELLC